MAERIDIDQFLCIDNLAFRSACNGAMEESKRPVARRVMQAVSQAEEARALIGAFLVGKGDRGTCSDCELAVGLVESICWETLVRELAAASKKRSPVSLLKRVLEFIRDKGKESAKPTARAATTAVLGTSVLFGTYYISPQAYRILTEPVRAVLTPDVVPVKITSDPPSGAIPVAFRALPDAITIPVRLEPEDGGRVTLHVRGEQGDAEALRALQTSVTEMSTRLGEVEGKVSGLKAYGPSQQIAQAINEFKQSLDDGGRTFLKQLPEYNHSFSDWQARVAAQEALASRIALTERLDFRIRSGATQMAVIPVDGAGSVGSLSLESIDIQFPGVVGRGSRMAVQLASGGHSFQLTQGESCKLGDTGYALSVESIDRNWVIYHSAHLILTPDNKRVSANGGQVQPCWDNRMMAKATAGDGPSGR